MDFITDKIIELLEKLPAEEPCLDYKHSPYKKNDIPEFLKDVISMLNTEQGIGKDKYIIIGVVDKTALVYSYTTLNCENRQYENQACFSIKVAPTF